MKPIIILPPETMSPEDIKLLRDNELCVVVCKEPAKVKFLDPIPSAAQRGKIDDAALKLSRVLLSGTWAHWSQQSVIGRGDFAKIYVDLLVRGTELDPNGSQREREQEFFSQEKLGELQRLAKQEAREERAAAKAAAAEKGKK